MLLERMYAPDVYYQKAGVMLMELVPATGQQMDLLGYSDGAGKAESLMTAIDKINERYGLHTVRLASQGYRNDWAMRRELKSRNYTAEWDELPTIGERFAPSSLVHIDQLHRKGG